MAPVHADEGNGAVLEPHTIWHLDEEVQDALVEMRFDRSPFGLNGKAMARWKAP